VLQTNLHLTDGESDSTTLSSTESVTYEATHSPTLLPPFRHATSSPTSHSSHRSHRAATNPVVIGCSSRRVAALTLRKVGRAEIAIRFGTNGNSLNCLRLKFGALRLCQWLVRSGRTKQIPKVAITRNFLPLDPPPKQRKYG
jgi:hypothetical protein